MEISVLIFLLLANNLSIDTCRLRLIQKSSTTIRTTTAATEPTTIPTIAPVESPPSAATPGAVVPFEIMAGQPIALVGCSVTESVADPDAYRTDELEIVSQGLDKVGDTELHCPVLVPYVASTNV